MRVCVYCASSEDVSPEFFEAASRLGSLLGSRGHELICGAGNEGLMRRVADSALSAGGSVTGVIPQFMAEKGWMHTGLSRTIITPDIHERKRRMADEADAAVALPGGCGTMEELLEIVTWKQLGLFKGKIVILNTAGYYDPLLEMLRQAVGRHFMKASHATLWHPASTPEEALTFLEDNTGNDPVEPKR